MSNIPLKKYVVMLKQKVRLPFRSKDEEIEQQFTVRAKTKQGALKSVRDAGHKGTIVDIKVVGRQS